MYTNVNLYDEAARETTITRDFRRDLIVREINVQTKQVDEIEITISMLKNELELLVNSKLRVQAFESLSERVVFTRSITLENLHIKKLTALYGGNILLKQPQNPVVNLSNHKISEQLQRVFNLGMQCHVQSKYNHIQRKIDVEKLYKQVHDQVSNKNLTVDNDDLLRCELRRFGLRAPHMSINDVLSKEDYKLIQEIKNKPDITIRKADKSNTFVIFNTQDYQQKLNDMLADETKFKKINCNPIEPLKKKINGLIDAINLTTNNSPLMKLVGHYKPGYVYGNAKIHKNLSDPPLRAIISQIGSPAYDISQKLNNLLKKYTPNKYGINSTDEFIQIIKSKRPTGMIASIDAVNLFTMVPVMATIDIILDTAYNHKDLPPPDIPKYIMKDLLVVCTTENPFMSPSGDIYKQVDGVSMGNPLGPLFANFYMANLENSVLDNLPTADKPAIYCWYVDDIFIACQNTGILENIKKQLEENSVLSFTLELEINRKLPFLDTIITRSHLEYVSDVFVKKTSTGECINYSSIAPDRYKTGVIKNLLNRAVKTCSGRTSLGIEIARIKQLLCNNNFPMKVIETECSKFMQKHIDHSTAEPQAAATPSTPISLFFRNQMTSQYKQDESNLKKIINSHVTPAAGKTVNLHIYYKNRKIQQLFVKNNPHKNVDESHVVYQYTCPQEECQPSKSYIGYTTNPLKKRMTTHAQNGSIISHQIESHQRRAPTSELMESTKVIFRSPETFDLKVAEALYIKTEGPVLNNQREGEVRISKVF